MKSDNWQAPASLKVGDRVGVVAPAGRLASAEVLQNGLQVLASWGLIPVLGKSLMASKGYFAGTDQERLSDLQAMLDDRSIKAVVCARGGYGTSLLLDHLDWEAFEQSPKWLVGFSDITALHLHLHNRGFQSIHGPNVASLQHGETAERLKSILFGQTPPLYAPAMEGNRKGTAIGPLIGGNLCVLLHQIGTSSQPNFSGKILLIEEVGEPPYRIDRALNQLQRIGALDEIAGLMVGDMGTKTEDYTQFGASLADIVYEKLGNKNMPVAFGWPVGHIADNQAAVFGNMAVMEVGEEGARVRWMGEMVNC